MSQSLSTLGKAIRTESDSGRAMFTILREMLGNKPSKTVANNTTLARDDDGNITVTLHWTKILTFRPDNTVTLRMGGWNSTTTRARINLFSPRYGVQFGVHTKKFVAYVTTFRIERGIGAQHVVMSRFAPIASVPFVEGITVNLDTGEIILP